MQFFVKKKSQLALKNRPTIEDYFEIIQMLNDMENEYIY